MRKVVIDWELRELLERVLRHDFAEDCQECAIGKSEAWSELRAVIAQPAEAEGVEAVEFWVLFDATTPEPYIKKMMPEGFLAFFDHEEDAIRAKSFHPGTDYKRVTYVRQSDHLSALSAVTAERDRLREQVAALQSGANSWQSGYDKGREDGAKSAGGWKDQHARDSAELRRLCAERDQLRQHKNDYMDAAEGTRKALLAEVEAFRPDAERYRWLRNPDQNVSLVLDKMTGEIPADKFGCGGYRTYEYRAGAELDDAIDAAMAAKEE